MWDQVGPIEMELEGSRKSFIEDRGGGWSAIHGNPAQKNGP